MPKWMRLCSNRLGAVKTITENWPKRREKIECRASKRKQKENILFAIVIILVFNWNSDRQIIECFLSKKIGIQKSWRYNGYQIVMHPRKYPTTELEK